jgi:hypothetical protein
MLLFHTNFETISHGEKKIGRTYKAVFSVDRHDEYLEYYEMTFAVNKTHKKLPNFASQNIRSTFAITSVEL